jgi:hypothetical protein
MLEILLLGVIHDYQWEKKMPLPEYLWALYLEQRTLYAQWVRGHVREFGPELIFDEMNLPQSKTCDDAEGLNRLSDTGVLWVYMDIPEEVRKKFGLSACRQPGSEWLPEIDEPREDYWVLVIEKISEACKLKKVFVLCGAAHLESFGSKLKRLGHQVEMTDVRTEPWFNLGWIRRPVGG